MNILLTVHCFYPKHIFGTETYTLEVAKAMQNLGHRVHVLTTNSHTEPSEGRPYVEYNYEGIHVISLDTTTHPNRIFKDTYYKDAFDPVIEGLIQELRPDVIHCMHTINLTVSFLKIVKKLNIPAFITLTDFFGVCFNCKLQKVNGEFCTGPNATASNCVQCYFDELRKSNQFVQKAGIIGKLATSPKLMAGISKLPFTKKVPVVRQIHHITNRKTLIQSHYSVFKKLIAPTEFLKKSYIRGGYESDRIKKLTFGINRTPIQDYAEPNTNYSKELTFGYIGQLYWHKGVDLLIQAFQDLNNPNIKLKIYGDLKQDYNYTERLHTLIGSNSNIELLGTFPRELQGQILSGIDILVIPSLWYENSPLVLLNALATRTPVIVSDVDGMNEFIKHGQNGYLFQTGSREDLRAKLSHCVENHEELGAVSVNTNYTKSIADNVQEILDIYKSEGIQ